ncbi:hypothetical protein VCJ71_08515 [Alteriqipengyuania sp. WL0013]|uniref:hypothetical protein n=1 Tax=Alteriqipengyuania sp. WL0013 TaxID=3110773 RepID=UPI002D1A6592|nr:hypothetical protein [Alteriqipengyuania sp. WL0013]MEB3416106.1 hypothetical protein [Alteriqipengyuania sp. WL0013]
MVRYLVALAAVLAFTPGGLANAQEAPRMDGAGGQQDLQIFVSSYGYTPRGEEPPYRQPVAIRDIMDTASGLTELIAAHSASPDDWRSGTVYLEIDEKGAVARCRLSDSARLPVSEEAMCAALAGEAFRPAIEADGDKVTGSYAYYFQRHPLRVDEGQARRPLFTRDPGLALAVPAPPPPLLPAAFPPHGGWMNYHYAQPQWRVEPRHGTDSAQPADDAVGVVAYEARGETRCDPSAEDIRNPLARRACAFVLETLAPTWPEPTGRRTPAVPLLVFADGDDLRAVGPAAEGYRNARFAEGQEELFRARLRSAGSIAPDKAPSTLRLILRFDNTGAVTHCRVGRTGGSDSGDLAACPIAAAGGYFEPVRDIFGRAEGGGLMYWNASDDAD